MKKMLTILIASLAAAIVFTAILFWTGFFFKDNIVEYGNTRVNHIISVDPDTFDRLIKQAFKQNITISDYLKQLTTSSTTITLGVKLPGGQTETHILQCNQLNNYFEINRTTPQITIQCP